MIKINIRSFSKIAKKYNIERKGYNDQVSDLRKTWSQTFHIQKVRRLEENMAEKERIILAKAARLREKRAESVAKQEVVKQQQEISRLKYKEQLAKSLLMQSKKQEQQSKRYKDLVNLFLEEQQCWINPNNLEEKISANLFTKPSTTGLVTNTSEHWRWHMITLNPKRTLRPEFIKAYSGSSPEDRMNIRGQLRSAKKIMAQDFLDPMIGSGEERAKYAELVDKFADMFEKSNSQPDVDAYFDYMLSKSDYSDYSSHAEANDEDDEDYDLNDLDLGTVAKATKSSTNSKNKKSTSTKKTSKK